MEIKQVDNTREEASAEINIDIPIDSPVIEKIAISGEWKKVNQTDRARADGYNNYLIDAFLMKARIVF